MLANLKVAAAAAILTISASAVVFATAGDPPAPAVSGPVTERPSQLAAVTCFKTGEQTSGMNKICYYNCVGSAAAITVGAAQLCPLSIKQ